jgi:hypothetical protein
MCWRTAMQLQHEDYSVVDRITGRLSTAFVQLRAQAMVRPAPWRASRLHRGLS